MTTAEQFPPGIGDAAISPPLFRHADIAGFGRVEGGSLRIARGALFVGTLLVCLLLTPWAFTTFWVVFETAAEVGVAPEARDWPWRAALVFSALAASGLAYLIQDQVAVLGGARARRILEEKARRMLGPLPDARFFVHLRLEDRATRRAFASEVGGSEDIGWLVPFPDRLEFVGDRWRITLPRGPGLGFVGLGGAAISLVFRAPDGVTGHLRLQSRDGDRISETSARVLGDALGAWLAVPGL